MTAKKTAATDLGVRMAEARRQMVIIGIDAALARTGWAVLADDVLVAHGLVVTRPRDVEAARLWRLWKEIGEVIRRYRTGRTAVVIERPGAWVRGKERSNLRAIEALAAARAAVKIMAAWQECAAVDLDVNEARRLVLGQTSGGPLRTKAWVVDLVELRFGVRVSHDEADAIVVAAAGYSLWKCGDARFSPLA